MRQPVTLIHFFYFIPYNFLRPSNITMAPPLQSKKNPSIQIFDLYTSISLFRFIPFLKSSPSHYVHSSTTSLPLKKLLYKSQSPSTSTDFYCLTIRSGYTPFQPLWPSSPQWLQPSQPWPLPSLSPLPMPPSLIQTSQRELSAPLLLTGALTDWAVSVCLVKCVAFQSVM